MWQDQSEQEGESEGRAQSRRERVCRVLWALGRSWAFIPSQVGALEGSEQRMGGT